jgi:hypothetical protein
MGVEMFTLAYDLRIVRWLCISHYTAHTNPMRSNTGVGEEEEEKNTAQNNSSRCDFWINQPPLQVSSNFAEMNPTASLFHEVRMLLKPVLK